MAKDKIYEKIAAYLKQSIQNGELKIGEAIYSENLLCEKFGVSRTSVRKALRMMIEQNLLVSVQGKGTFVKGAGQGSIYETICLVNHWSRALRYDAFDTYLRDIIIGVERAVRNADFNFQVYSGVINRPEEIAQKMRKIKADGLVIDGQYLCHMTGLDAFAEIAPNLIVADGNPEETDLPVVISDARSGFVSLLQLAAKRPGPIIFLYHDHHTLNRWRLHCFRQALHDLDLSAEYINYGANINLDTFLNVDHYPLVYQSLQAFAVGKNRGGTIISVCDHTAAKAVRVLEQQGWQVPKDFAVSGFAGFALSALVNPPLTTVRIDSALIGDTAVKCLMDKIKGKSIQRVNMIETNLIERESL